jgi:hypothetical protein
MSQSRTLLVILLCSAVSATVVTFGSYLFGFNQIAYTPDIDLAALEALPHAEVMRRLEQATVRVTGKEAISAIADAGIVATVFGHAWWYAFFTALLGASLAVRVLDWLRAPSSQPTQELNLQPRRSPPEYKIAGADADSSSRQAVDLSALLTNRTSDSRELLGGPMTTLGDLKLAYRATADPLARWVVLEEARDAAHAELHARWIETAHHGEPKEPESYWGELLAGVSLPVLLRFTAILDRYARFLNYKGHGVQTWENYRG